MASPTPLNVATGSDSALEIRYHPNNTTAIAGILAIIAGFVYAFFKANRNPNGAPALPDPIPFVWNAYQYMTDQVTLLGRVREALKRHPIVSLHVGPMKFYMVKSPRSIQALFRTSPSISSNKFMHLIFENLMNFTEEDVAKFMNDNTGRLATPILTPSASEIKRYWQPYHKILHDYLARSHETNKLGLTYEAFFNEHLVKKSPVVGQYTTVHIGDFLYRDMFIAATTAFCGPRVLELNPDLVEIFWKHHVVAVSLVYGLPRFLNKRALHLQKQFHEAGERYLRKNFDECDNSTDKDGKKWWDSEEARRDWEPIWGSSANRELCKWLRDEGFDMRSQRGLFCITNIFGSNANSIPIAIWMVMYIVSDPALLRAIRQELDPVFSPVDPSNPAGEKRLDIQKMLSLPLLQSVYAECLRMHVSINVTREVLEPVLIEGYLIEKGAIIQGPAEIAHYEEDSWGASSEEEEGQKHPASEFWAERHIKVVQGEDGKKVKQFGMSGRGDRYFPYGGGVSMCPGRFFAKQEMMMTAAMLVARFDIEFVEWTHLEDGSKSDRPARNHAHFIGGASVPPDRDMKVRWKRLW